jgi:hypothetical protein
MAETVADIMILNIFEPLSALPARPSKRTPTLPAQLLLWLSSKSFLPHVNTTGSLYLVSWRREFADFCQNRARASDGETSRLNGTPKFAPNSIFLTTSWRQFKFNHMCCIVSEALKDVRQCQ